MIRNIFKKIFQKKENKILLGRWNNNGKEIKSIYANHDHCGDIICKDPKELTKIVKKELTRTELKK